MILNCFSIAALFLITSFGSSAYAGKEASALCPIGPFSKEREEPALEYPLAGAKKIFVCGFRNNAVPGIKLKPGTTVMSEFDVFEIGPNEKNRILISFGAVDDVLVAFDPGTRRLKLSPAAAYPPFPGQGLTPVSYKTILFDCAGAECIQSAVCTFESDAYPKFDKTVVELEETVLLKQGKRKLSIGSGAVLSELLLESLRGSQKAVQILRKLKNARSDGHVSELISKYNEILDDARAVGCSIAK